jgi:hypothetical protein
LAPALFLPAVGQAPQRTLVSHGFDYFFYILVFSWLFGCTIGLLVGAVVHVDHALTGAMMNNGLFSLTDAIASLRSEISSAVTQGADEQLRFSLGDIELEFAVVARREGGGDGRVKFSILGIGAEAGASGKVGREQTQKVRIKLNAQLRSADGTQAEILVRRPDQDGDYPF